MSRREKKEISTKNMKKKIIISAIFLSIMLCAILLTWKILLMSKTEKVNSDINNNEVLLQNETENTIADEETKVENKNESLEIKNEVVSSEEKSIDEIEKEEDKKEKAITLTKNNWGDDATVYFTFDSIDEHGNYIVYIREKTTTHAVARSVVDIETGTCTLE